MEASFSSVDTYTRCPRRYKLNYIDRLGRSGLSASPMLLGTAVHNGMAFGLHLLTENSKLDTEALTDKLSKFFSAWYDANKCQISDEDFNSASKYAELLEMTVTALNVVVRTLGQLEYGTKYTTVMLDGKPLIERKLTIKLDDDTNFNFQVDWVAQDTDGVIHLFDWKTRRSFQEDENDAVIIADDFNVQMCLYQYALNLLGVPVEYAVTYQIAPAYPKRPEVLNSGDRVSKKYIKTDWETFKQTILDIGDNPEDEYYADVKKRLEEIVWWKPITRYRSAVELKSRWDDMVAWTGRIKTSTVFPKIENTQCKFCPFSRICIADARGWDVKLVIDNEYEVRYNQPELDIEEI